MLDIGLSCLTLTPRLALNRNDRFDRSDYNDVLDVSLSHHGRCVRRDMARTLALLSPRARQCEALPIPLPPAAVAAERRADLSSLPGRTPPHVDAGGSDVLRGSVAGGADVITAEGLDGPAAGEWARETRVERAGEGGATIVTAYYPVPSKFAPKVYHVWMSNLLLHVRSPMVIFTGVPLLLRPFLGFRV